MRANGIEETYIAGDAADEEKCMARAKTMLMANGNPSHDANAGFFLAKDDVLREFIHSMIEVASAGL